MKLAHISDLHINALLKHSNIKKTKYLLDHILEKGYDHIAVTGDLSDNASYKDLEILRKIFSEFGLLSPDKLSLVIGNHDIYGGLMNGDDLLSFPERCRNTDIKRKLFEFGEYFRESFAGSFLPNSPEIFPYAKELDDAVIVGINSIPPFSKLKNPFTSNGKVDNFEIDGLKKIFARVNTSGKVVIVLIHHHFYKKYFHSGNNITLWKKVERESMKLLGRNKLITFLNENNVRIVLHGHVHESVEYWKGKIRILNAGATFNKNEMNEISFNSLDIRNNLISTELITFPFPKKVVPASGSSIFKLAEMR